MHMQIRVSPICRAYARRTKKCKAVVPGAQPLTRPVGNLCRFQTTTLRVVKTALTHIRGPGQCRCFAVVHLKPPDGLLVLAFAEAAR